MKQYNFVVALGAPAPTNVRIISNNPNELDVNWIPHCDSEENCNENNYPDNRKPKQYIVKYKLTDDNSNGEEKTIGEPTTNFPATSVTLKDLKSNTEYDVVVRTITFYNTNGGGIRPVGTDFSRTQAGKTSNSSFFTLFRNFV